MWKRIGVVMLVVFAIAGALVFCKGLYDVGSVLVPMALSADDTRADLAYLRAARMQAIREAQAKAQARAQNPVAVPKAAEKEP